MSFKHYTSSSGLGKNLVENGVDKSKEMRSFNFRLLQASLYVIRKPCISLEWRDQKPTMEVCGWGVTAESRERARESVGVGEMVV